MEDITRKTEFGLEKSLEDAQAKSGCSWISREKPDASRSILFGWKNGGSDSASGVEYWTHKKDSTIKRRKYLCPNDPSLFIIHILNTNTSNKRRRTEDNSLSPDRGNVQMHSPLQEQLFQPLVQQFAQEPQVSQDLTDEDMQLLEQKIIEQEQNLSMNQEIIVQQEVIIQMEQNNNHQLVDYIPEEEIVWHNFLEQVNSLKLVHKPNGQIGYSQESLKEINEYGNGVENLLTMHHGAIQKIDERCDGIETRFAVLEENSVKAPIDKILKPDQNFPFDNLNVLDVLKQLKEPATTQSVRRECQQIVNNANPSQKIGVLKNKVVPILQQYVVLGVVKQTRSAAGDNLWQFNANRFTNQ
eukprot:TRINITY_DN3781_c0_g1_i4.p1 TRINITY_DN3781_c0_g1~~TRINITY_DN3781_c0_g1_i4.p1  ORF type:complete len:405 (+),score=83.19 TRINITY_DN3781_c0_g1_i4:150-1217(+)